MVLFLSLGVVPGPALAASVGPSGYTNAFDTQPLAADWATARRAGGASDSYDMDSDVNTNITVSLVSQALAAVAGNPAAANTNAVWGSTGFFLQTRPSGGRYTALMGKFVNNTGTNATEIALSYWLTVAGSGSAEETGKGTRVYYSFTGLLNSWTNLPTLNNMVVADTNTVMGANLALNWPDGANLFLLWTDDNSSGSTVDSANQIDNFSLLVTAGYPPGFACTLSAPARNSYFLTGSSITATAAVALGTAPYRVEFYTNSGAGNLVFQSAGSSVTAPHTVTLAALPPGTYNIFAVATDSAAEPASTFSVTNTFAVVDAMAVALTAPADGAIFDNSTPITASVTVAGGTPPYAVQFYVDGAAKGSAVTVPPFSHDLGAQSIGDHTVRATVVDGRGWSSNTVTHVVHVGGPISATLTPTNGTAYYFGQSVNLSATVIGGTAPYTVSFYTNDVLVGSFGAAPCATNLGRLPVGSYTCYVHALDSSVIVEQTNSSTNVVTIAPNPLSVALTSPTAGQSVSAGSALSLAATATIKSPLAVSKVEFFYDGSSVGVDTASPYSVSVTPAVGTHTAYAVATDNLGRVACSPTNQFTAIISGPPANNDFNSAITLSGISVTTAGYNNNATKERFTFGWQGEPNHAGNSGGASVWWTWTAPVGGLTTIDTEGSTFNTLLAVYTVASSWPFTTLTSVAGNDDYSGNTWSRVTFTAVAGTAYRIAVDGYNSGGAAAAGNILLRIVGPGGVTISSPTNNMQFTYGDSIPIAVDISSSFPNPPASQVEFYRGTTLIGSDSTAPFGIQASNTPAGYSTFYVVATDSTGQKWQSPSVMVLVLNVGVTLLTPVDDTMFTSNSPITVTAGAAVQQGAITNIEFYVDGVKFGEDAVAPFSATWSAVTGGSHRLTAVGRSDTGASYASQPVNIGVATTLMAYGSAWKYLDNGSDQGTAWIAPDFDDSAWPSGPAPLGYGDSNGRNPATTCSYGPDANNKYPTTYFRQAVVLTNAAAFNGITLSLERDDGAIVYLNGSEVGRFNMNDGAPSYASYAAGNASDDGVTVFSTNVSPARFVTGTNVFAVEIHQDAADSSDIWFQMQLIGLPVIIHNLFPTVSLTSPTNAQYYLAPPAILLEAAAADPDGSVAKVEFFVDGTKLGEDGSAPYSFEWSVPALGEHVLTAVATDNTGATTTSSRVPIVVYDSAGRPAVKITSPLDGAIMVGPTNLVLTASAQALQGVTNVQFFANGLLIGNDRTAPYSVLWPSTFFSNGLVAVAYDANGVAGTSAVVRVSITKAPPIVAGQTPSAGTIITNLTSLSVTFSKSVQHVDAADLLVSGVPATQVTAMPDGSNYVFTFPHPAYGTVSVSWASDAGITDTEPEQNPFDVARPGNSWTYALVDQTPPAIASQNPPAGALVTNLTQITVLFTEPVSGVNAADLLINGSPATSVTGSGATYTFSFPQPNATLVNVTWAMAHGIRDLAVTPNVFVAGALGATWSYLTPDNVSPALASLSPPAGATVRSLLQITVVFSESVTGVDATDLLLNGSPARQVSGAGAGPYTFTYPPPSNGPVDVRWSAAHGISDLATPPNAFIGGQWSYIVDTNAAFADKIVINEIMYNPSSGRVADEWIELHNVGSDPMNLAGWHFTRGVDFAFPSVSVAPDGYLVVAADLAAFKARYPAVTNVVGGWTGRLANNGETLEIATAENEVVDRVHYANEGDWARREQGRGASPVTAITRSGSTATVALFGHNFTENDRVLISGADQPEYNGVFVVSSPASATFAITVPGAPASPATGRIICRQVLDNGAAGWSWFSAADGFGSSLELVNPALPNTIGQNWLASATPDGTPGRPNSVLSTNVAPFIQDVTHFPVVPRSTNSVTISARISDQKSNGVQSVTLFYRSHTSASPGAFTAVTMFDDGAHSDGVADDGLYAATLAPQANGSIIEFYVQALGSSGLSRTWPAPAWQTNNTFIQSVNALYQVDNESSATNMPFLRMIMTETERSQLNGIDTDSDAAMNATFIALDGEGAKVRYNCSMRLRGAGSRDGTPKNFRLTVPADNPWNGRTRLNLNSRYVHAQLVGSVLSQRVGLPTESARVVQFRVNGQNLASASISFGCYVLAEPMNGDWAANHFPLDPDGNVYRASRWPWTANLDYIGANNASYQGYTGAGYYKASNAEENDWSDLIRLTYTLSSNTPDADYVSAVRTNLNVEEWMLYFMVFNFFDSQESSLGNGIGDDYALYRGLVDPRFRLVGHDYDTILGQGDTAQSTTRSIWNAVDTPRATDTAQRANFLPRFMRHQEFAPIYFRVWKQHLDTTFSPEQLNPVLDDLLGGWVTGTAISDMKTFAASRRAYVLTQITTNLTIATGLTSNNGYFRATGSNVTLNGQAHIVDTRRVLVNGSPATWSAWQGRWTNTVVLQPGINRVLVQSLDSNNLVFASAAVDIWYDDSTVQTAPEVISANTTWSAAGGPYGIDSSMAINSGATLNIQPGTTVYLGSGVNLTVASGGALIATGTPTAPIRFTRAPGTSSSWGGITINGGAGSPETRIAFAHLEFNGSTAIHSSGGTVFFDHLTFGNTAVQYLSLDSSSFVVQDCTFPATTDSFEPVHGSGGIKAGGRGIFLRNFWGPITGYNDSIDFTGGQRPGPIVQFINNVFVGTGDDFLDLDNTDAWVEGNIFMHAHKNGTPDTSSAISGGNDTGEPSDITIIGNLIFDCDHAANAKQDNFYTMLNNTIVKQTHTGGSDTEGAVVVLADNNMTEGRGILLEGNIIVDAETLTRAVATALVTYTNNIIYQLSGTPWSGAGGANLNVDPLLKRIPAVSETTNFTSWAQAQVLWDWLSLKTGSPAAGAGPNGRDLGAPVRCLGSGAAQPLHGVSLSGEPVGSTSSGSATLRLDPPRSGNGIPATSAGFPNGSGFTHYKWRLDAGVWSAETPAATPITLADLAPGSHYVEVVGKNDAGIYQDDPVLGSDATISVSRTWTVNPSATPVILNEILASNNGALDHEGTTPDAVELFNITDAAIDLTGVRLTDDQSTPDKFIFPAGASIPAHGYLVVFANKPDGTSGYHLGFNLSQSGAALYLYASASGAGALLDSVTFGPQLTDLSIGRLADGGWALTVPTLGGRNQAAAIGDPAGLRLNEWLALGVAPFNNDFIELYNPNALPVSLGGMYLSDHILGWRDRSQIPALSFIAGHGYVRFFADGDAAQGAEHLDFSLSGDQGAIGLYLPDLTPVDQVTYLAQRVNVSQGRNPNGGGAFVYFDQPTPGAPNPLSTGPAPNGGLLVINEVLADNSSLAEGGRTPDWLELYNGAATNVHLGDMSLTDDTLQPRRFVFPSGTVLNSGAFLRVLCDPAAATAGALLNTNFALKSSGGGVYLFDAPANGGGLIGTVIYGLQVPNLSIGRVPDGSTNWFLCGPTPGAGNRAVTSLGNPANLKVNEWMADPKPGDDDWFELYNPDPQPVALGGLYLTDDLNNRAKHQVLPLSFLGSGTNAWRKFVADGNTGAGADHVGFSLRGSGEAIGLYSSDGVLIDGLAFEAQTQGVSEGRFPDGSATIVAFPGTDSPGKSNWRQLSNVAINEVLTHTDLPIEDAIELHNLTASPVDVAGWWLSDDDNTLQKFRIPAPCVIPPFGFLVIYEFMFTNREMAAIPFALSSRGDEVVLSAFANNAFTGWRAHAKFGAAENGVSFGRYVTSDNREEFVAMSARSFGMDNPATVAEFRTGAGQTNPYPKVGPVVISEIMYHPPSLGTNDDTRDEFIELRNTSAASVALFENTNAWHLRNAVDFDFPPGSALAPGASLLVVGFDPVNNPAALAAFRSAYQLDSNTTILGPWIGKLANDNDDIELRRPGAPDTNGVPYILVERVHYYDGLPWPGDADGAGLSLQRQTDAAFGNDPANWLAAAPTPGRGASTSDSDGDGMPDAWETAHGLDPLNPADAAFDPDRDGLSNLQECLAGTDPKDPASSLKLEIAVASGGANVVLSFAAVSGLSYAIESQSAPQTSWTLVMNIVAAPENRVAQVTVPIAGAMRIFRLRTPALTSGTPDLRITSIQLPSGGKVKLALAIPANQDCSLQYSSSLLTSAWNIVTNYPAAPTNRIMRVDAPAAGASTFYRLLGP